MVTGVAWLIEKGKRQARLAAFIGYDKMDKMLLSDPESSYTEYHTAAKVVNKTSENNFEELYTAVRHHEKKIYTDSQLKALPNFDGRSEEWEIRRHSSHRLTHYITLKKKPLNILEVGCGNGWLAAMLAGIPGATVTGLDVNSTEIAQANRVFKENNLQFITDNFNEYQPGTERFDILVFAAALQYFPSAAEVLTRALDVLNPGGEIHIIDTPFYTRADALLAAQRCRDYYTDMGIPEMAGHYFHHSINEMHAFKYRIFYNPRALLNRLLKKGPFCWIVINK